MKKMNFYVQTCTGYTLKRDIRVVIKNNKQVRQIKESFYNVVKKNDVRIITLFFPYFVLTCINQSYNIKKLKSLKNDKNIGLQAAVVVRNKKTRYFS
jgi:hypothetical protein